MALQLTCRGQRVALYATTGAAASRLSRSAMTVHSGFAIPPHGGTIRHMRANDPLFLTLIDADTILIDEFSMLSSLNLDNVMYRLTMVAAHQLNMSIDDLLKHKRVVLVGDHAQLGCVCRCRQDEETCICWTCHITNSHWYTKATEHHLTASVRAAGDPPFAQFQTVRRAHPAAGR
jgi:hypothetical protein